MRLHATYSRTGKQFLGEIISVSRFVVIEDTDYDNWNGGVHGHDLKLFLPLDVLGQIELDDVSEVASALQQDLNKLTTSIANEYIAAVHLEMEDEADPDFRKSIAFSPRRTAKPEAVHFWKPAFARVFVSHRDQHKVAARSLAEALSTYGISSFVAHDTIKPMSEWRAEIMKGLETMEVMLLFLTDDFEESCWTNQEVGYALGNGVPVVSLKLGRKDPPGFVSHLQAFKGRPESPAASARGLFPLIVDALGRQERLQEMMIRSFVEAGSFADAIERFDRMREVVTKLSPAEVKTIADGFRSNGQLRGCAYLGNGRLKKFLESLTGDRFEIVGEDIRKLAVDKPAPTWDEVPF